MTPRWDLGPLGGQGLQRSFPDDRRSLLEGPCWTETGPGHRRFSGLQGAWAPRSWGTRAVIAEVCPLIHRLARSGRRRWAGGGSPRPGRRAGRPVRGGDRAVRPPRDRVPAAGGVEHGAVATAADARGHARPSRSGSRRPSPTCSRPAARSRTPRHQADPRRPRPTTSTTPTTPAGPSPPSDRGNSLTVGFTRDGHPRRGPRHPRPDGTISLSSGTASASPARSPGRSPSPTTPPRARPSSPSPR